MGDRRTALVLGGGGITGIAWEVGVLAGLADAGIDLTSADLVVGTSAGSVVGAQLTCGADLAGMYQRQLEPPEPREPVARMTRANLVRYGLALLLSRGRGTAFRRRMGSLALAAERAGLTPSEQERLDVIGARVSAAWPGRPLVVTAVDAGTGEFTPFDRSSGLPLLVAVAASCAVPGVYPPVTIGGRRYVDGGMRSPTNADLAVGYERVVVLAPLPRGRGPITGAAAHLPHLSPRVAVLSPDATARAAIGRDVLDPAARAPSARAGREQAAAVVEQVAAAWAP